MAWMKNVVLSLILPTGLGVLLAPVVAADEVEGAIEADVRDYGAIGDGRTDNTPAFAAAVAALAQAGGGVLRIPTGTFVGHIVLNQRASQDKTITLRGTSSGASILKANADDPIVDVTTGGTWYAQWCVENIMFHGSNRATGLRFQASSASSMHVTHCDFNYCDRGIISHGPIGYTIEQCGFSFDHVGIWIESLATMHGGCAAMRDNTFYQCDTTAIGIKGVSGTGVEQVVISGAVVEGCKGFGIWARNLDPSFEFLMDDIYFELCGTAESVTLDGVTGDPNTVRLDSVPRARIRNAKLGDADLQLTANTHLWLDSCWWYHPSTVSVDANSICESTGCVLEASSPANSHVIVHDFITSPVGAYQCFAQMPIRRNYVFDRTNLLPDITHPWTSGLSHVPSGDSAVWIRSDAPEFGTCLQLRVKPCATYADGIRIYPSPITCATGKWTVWSGDFREADSNSVVWNWQDNNGSAVAVDVEAVPGRWRRFYNIHQNTHKGDIYYYLRLANLRSAHPETVQIANFQMVQFDTREEANRFVNEGSMVWPASRDRTNGMAVISLATDQGFLYGGCTYLIDTSADTIDPNLSDGTFIGDRVECVMKVAGHNFDLTVSHHVTSDPEVIRLDAAKEWVELIWDGADWVETSGIGQTYP